MPSAVVFFCFAPAELALVLAIPSPFSSGIIIFKEWAKSLENGWFPKRTLGEENGESNLSLVDGFRGCGARLLSWRNQTFD